MPPEDDDELEGILDQIPEAPGEEGEEFEELSPEQGALKEMYEAMKGGDWAAAEDAFKTAYDLCRSSSKPMMQEEPEAEPTDADLLT